MLGQLGCHRVTKQGSQELNDEVLHLRIHEKIMRDDGETVSSWNYVESPVERRAP